MNSLLPHENGSLVRPALRDGALAAALSSIALAWRGRTEIGSAAAALNAPSHWIYGDQALRRNAATLRFTLTGALVHAASAMLWGGVYRALRAQRAERSPVTAVIDAAAVTGVAALVDLKLVPRRLTPGFERRLSSSGVLMVYASVAAGLAIGGLLSERLHDR
jgi:hypothetical protein